MRTIKQIAAVREREGDTLYGVANDGSVWEMFTGADKLHWSRLPDLPQEATLSWLRCPDCKEIGYTGNNLCPTCNGAGGWWHCPACNRDAGDKEADDGK